VTSIVSYKPARGENNARFDCIVEMTEAIAGPYCASIGDFVADVI